MKALAGTFNQEKALVGAFSVIVKTSPMVRLQLYSVLGASPDGPGGLLQLEVRLVGAARGPAAAPPAAAPYTHAELPLELLLRSDM